MAVLTCRRHGRLTLQNCLLILDEGDSDIYVIDASGANPRRLTSSKGPDVSPVWNPKNRRTDRIREWSAAACPANLIFVMAADGTNAQRVPIRLCVSPAWSPNGQFLLFSWMRKYGLAPPVRRTFI